MPNRTRASRPGRTRPARRRAAIRIRTKTILFSGASWDLRPDARWPNPVNIGKRRPPGPRAAPGRWLLQDARPGLPVDRHGLRGAERRGRTDVEDDAGRLPARRVDGGSRSPWPPRATRSGRPPRRTASAPGGPRRSCPEPASPAACRREDGGSSPSSRRRAIRRRAMTRLPECICGMRRESQASPEEPVAMSLHSRVA